MPLGSGKNLFAFQLRQGQHILAGWASHWPHTRPILSEIVLRIHARFERDNHFIRRDDPEAAVWIDKNRVDRFQAWGSAQLDEPRLCRNGAGSARGFAAEHNE